MTASTGPPVQSGRFAFDRVFAVDPRSLAMLRIGLGVVLLLNLYALLPEVPAFFTDQGILSRETRLWLTAEEESTAPPYWVSAHMLDGGAPLQYALFAVAAVFALALLVGYRTRLAVFGSWVLVVGLQARNPLILHGGDQLVRCLLFWCLFLPLGAQWSWDARHRTDSPGPICSLASAGLLIQLVCMYLSTAIVKDDPQWRTEGSAIYYALQTDLFTTSLGHELIEYPGLLHVLTTATLILEFAGPLMLLIPWRGWMVRTAVVASFFGLHLGIAATMDLGLFPYACIVYWLAFLPGGFWDALGRRQPSAEPVTATSASESRLSGAGRGILLVALAYVILVTFVRTRNGADAEVPGPLRMLGRALQLDQSWYLFAPRPHDFGGWFDVRGTLPDGTQVSLLHGDGAPRTIKPELPLADWPAMGWRRLILDLCEYGDCRNVRAGSVDYFRRLWDDTHSLAERLVVVEFIAIMEPTPPPGLPRDPAHVRVMVLARWDDRMGFEQPAVPFVKAPGRE